MSVYDLIPARPTTYRGIPMRSRLEARFAAFLDDNGATWTYEPRAFGDQSGQYLPDFGCLAPNVPMAYVEVKPTMDLALEATSLMQIIWSSEPDALLMVAVGGTDSVLIAGRDRRWTVERLAGWS